MIDWPTVAKININKIYRQPIHSSSEPQPLDEEKKKRFKQPQSLIATTTKKSNGTVRHKDDFVVYFILIGKISKVIKTKSKHRYDFSSFYCFFTLFVFSCSSSLHTGMCLRIYEKSKKAKNNKKTKSKTSIGEYKWSSGRICNFLHH